MESTPIRFKTTLALMQQIGVDAIDEALCRMMPGATCGFVTYEADDYEKGSVTYLLYNDFPESFFVTVTHHTFLHHAVKDVIGLNLYSGMECVIAGYSNDNIDKLKTTQELRIISTNMSINIYGRLQKNRHEK